MRALRPRGQRYSTAAEFADALERSALASNVSIAQSRDVGELLKARILAGELPTPPRGRPPSAPPTSMSVNDALPYGAMPVSGNDVGLADEPKVSDGTTTILLEESRHGARAKRHVHAPLLLAGAGLLALVFGGLALRAAGSGRREAGSPPASTASASGDAESFAASSSPPSSPPPDSAATSQEAAEPAASISPTALPRRPSNPPRGRTAPRRPYEPPLP
jgi:hypothetical protein